MDLLDPSKYNSNKYKELFSSMSDTAFSKWINNLLGDEDNNFRLEVTSFKQNQDDLRIENIKKAADYLKVPLDEYIYMPFMNPEGKPLRSRDPVPVGYIHIRRLGMKRFLRKIA